MDNKRWHIVLNWHLLNTKQNVQHIPHCLFENNSSITCLEVDEDSRWINTEKRNKCKFWCNSSVTRKLESHSTGEDPRCRCGLKIDSLNVLWVCFIDSLATDQEILWLLYTPHNHCIKLCECSLHSIILQWDGSIIQMNQSQVFPDEQLECIVETPKCALSRAYPETLLFLHNCNVYFSLPSSVYKSTLLPGAVAA